MINDKSKSLIIIGASGLGKEIAWVANRIGIFVQGFLDDEPGGNGKAFYNKTILGVTKDWVNYKDCQFIIAVANTRTRKKIVSKHFSVNRPAFATLIDPSAITSDISIGENSFVNAGSICTADVCIGNHSIINKLVSIGHDVSVGDFVTIAPQVMVGGTVELQDGVELGAGTKIKQGLTVGSGTSTGMGAVIAKETVNNGLYLGVPAKRYKELELF
jgi:sugar O-acyltransferase (sialic acid O-acetyltransferase NeuD family)